MFSAGDAGSFRWLGGAIRPEINNPPLKQQIASASVKWIWYSNGHEKKVVKPGP
jgi:hypothetical protein